MVFLILFIDLSKKRNIFNNFSHPLEEKAEMNLPINEQIINDSLSILPEKYKNQELKTIHAYKLLAYNSSKNDLKRKLFKFVSIKQKKDINKVDCLILRSNLRFGNLIIALNNAIFYCEILECKKIIIFEGYGVIKNVIKYNYQKNKTMKIISGNNFYSNSERGVCFNLNLSFFFFPKYVFPQIRTDSIKEEILRNLPHVNISPDDNYIYIRSGDIFSAQIHKYYSQPPLCFYEKIINNFKYRNYYIISENKNNPVIKGLLNKFSFVIYKRNSFKIDLSIICHAYNLVGGVSSFIISSIKFNDNLINFWQYNIYKIREMLYHLHQDIYNFKIKYNVYSMEPSFSYKNEMFIWRNKGFQKNLMLNNSCPFNFTLRKADID